MAADRAPWGVRLILALAVPGLGHFLSRRSGKGLLFFVTILGTYGFGWGISRGEAVSFRRHPLTLAAQIGATGPTTLALLASRGREERKWLDALVRSRAITKEELRRIRDRSGGGSSWVYLRRQIGVPEEALRAAYREASLRAEPRLDIGVLFVMVAGLLNALVAFDAAEGDRRQSRAGPRAGS